jgi:hypothetical protein
MTAGPPKLPGHEDLEPPLPRVRSRMPSAPEFLEAVTTRHRPESDPPWTRWIDRRIGRAFRLTAMWLWRTKAGTLTFASVTGAVVHVANRLHWLDWLWRWK